MQQPGGAALAGVAGKPVNYLFNFLGFRFPCIVDPAVEFEDDPGLFWGEEHLPGSRIDPVPRRAVLGLERPYRVQPQGKRWVIGPFDHRIGDGPEEHPEAPFRVNLVDELKSFLGESYDVGSHILVIGFNELRIRNVGSGEPWCPIAVNLGLCSYQVNQGWLDLFGTSACQPCGFPGIGQSSGHQMVSWGVAAYWTNAGQGGLSENASMGA